MKMRSAPKGGYDFPAKTAFRRWAWSWIGGQIEGTDTVETGNVLLMPSTEGLEISAEALPRGFTLDQLYVVDSSPAVVATIQRKFPGVHTYGCSVDKAVDRITDQGVSLIAANLDYCCQVSQKLFSSLQKVADSPCLRDALLFVTCLRGREELFLQRLINPVFSGAADFLEQKLRDKESLTWLSDDGIEPTELDVRRLLAIAQVANRYVLQARAYRSVNGQTFLSVLLDKQKLDYDKIARCREEYEFWGDPITERWDPAVKSWKVFVNGLTRRQHVRLHAMCLRGGVPSIDKLQSVFRMEEGRCSE